MDIIDLFRILWRRKVIVLVSLVLTVATAFAYLTLTDPVYEAESTMAVSPISADDLVFLSAVDTIVPVYADAASSPTTRTAAEADLGRPLGDVFVEAFEGTPIFRIRARSTDPKQAQETAQAVTDALLRRVTSGEIGVSGLELEQLDRPSLPTVPVYPRRYLTVAVAVLVGTTLGLGLALLRQRLSSRVDTVEDLSRAVGAPGLAEIPEDRVVQSLRNPEDLINRPRLRVVAEGFRDLRTALLYSNSDVRSILVTSPEGRHGKTTVALGLAATLARLGTRTLLVDGDLHRGRLGQLLSIPARPGLTDVLMGLPLSRATRHTALEALDVLPSGEMLQNPTELIERVFHTVLTEAGQSYESIVIDSTPLVPVNDARIMASFASTTILVAMPPGTNRASLRVAVERLATIGVLTSGVVLNGSRKRRPSSYYAYLQPEPGVKRTGRSTRRSRRARAHTST
jgi:capsular exopolysaccharide synthesis family protein